MDAEQSWRNALCELIDTNIHLLETLRKQFVIYESHKHYWSRHEPKVKLHELEAQDEVLQGVMGTVDSVLRIHGSSLGDAIHQVQQARSRVAESCCFISKLPNELLSDILQRASDCRSTFYTYTSDFLFELASVCRRWRAIVISIPSLWTEISLAPGSHQPALRKEFWQIICTCTQNTPVNISISDGSIFDDLTTCDKELWERMSEGELADTGYVWRAIDQMSFYDLKRLSVINSITIKINNEQDIQRLLDPEYENLNCLCETLLLEGKKDNFDAQLSVLLYHFDARVVKCAYARELNPGMPFSGRNLTEIHLSYIGWIPLDDLLANYIEIKVLRCINSTIKWQTEQTLVHSGLRELKLEYNKASNGCRWLDRLHCPGLTRLEAAKWANDNAFIKFIDRSPHLRSIGLENSDEQQLLPLVDHLPEVDHLDLLPDAVKLLYNWTSYHRSRPPFPLLESLYIYRFDGDKHTTLLPLIRERCLAPHVSSEGIKRRITLICVEVISGRDIVESTVRDSGVAELRDAKWEGQFLEIRFENLGN